MPARDPAVSRFIEQHAVGRRASAIDDASSHVGTTPEERLVQLVALCRLTAGLARAGRAPDAAFNYQEPPHAGWHDLVRRHRRVAR